MKWSQKYETAEQSLPRNATSSWRRGEARERRRLSSVPSQCCLCNMKRARALARLSSLPSSYSESRFLEGTVPQFLISGTTSKFAVRLTPQNPKGATAFRQFEQREGGGRRGGETRGGGRPAVPLRDMVQFSGRTNCPIIVRNLNITAIYSTMSLQWVPNCG